MSARSQPSKALIISIYMYIYKKNSEQSRKYGRQESEDKRRRNRGREREEQRTGTVEYSHRKGDTALGQLIGVRGRRQKDGRQRTDHLRQGTEERRQGTYMRQGTRKMGDKEQRLRNANITGDKGHRYETIDSGPEARNRDVRGFIGSES